MESEALFAINFQLSKRNSMQELTVKRTKLPKLFMIEILVTFSNENSIKAALRIWIMRRLAKGSEPIEFTTSFHS